MHSILCQIVKFMDGKDYWRNEVLNIQQYLKKNPSEKTSRFMNILHFMYVYLNCAIFVEQRAIH